MLALQLADFGFSKDPKQQSEAKTRVGTPAYLAPEVIAAQPGKSYNAEVGVELVRSISRQATSVVPWHKEPGGQACRVGLRAVTRGPCACAADALRKAGIGNAMPSRALPLNCSC